MSDGKREIAMAGPWVTEDDVQIVLDALRNGWYKDPYYYVETFQNEFAAYHGRRFGLMTPNCTTAIHLLLAGLGISDDDEVIVPECTWIASTAPVVYQRGKPVFCDIEAGSWCLDPQAAEAAITPKTKAIIAVDLFGNMPNMDALQEIATRHGLFLVEDAAEALGSKYKGTRAGKFGVGSVFSFHRTKTITTGEGGMLLLDDEELYNRCKVLRDHGRIPGGPMYYNYEVTFKYMPFNVQAALGYAQFKRLEEIVDKKRWILHTYKKHLADVPDLQLNDEPEHVYNGVWSPAIVFGHSHGLEKQQIIDLLAKEDVPSRPFFYPLSSLPAFPDADEELHKKRNPVAYDISGRGINVSCALNLEE
ncbi:MAG: DegT/DnrJ/EryC1/StrS family aminotransferase, partial [bacterium]|nr:DegT/DnrJ/EryC1/StrS family aminotransferase [bacterium]